MTAVVINAQMASLYDLLNGIDPNQRWLLLVIVIGCSVGLILGTVGIVASTIRSVQRNRAEIQLKREMIDRGMSADEIAKIIEAATPPEDGYQRWIASWGRPKRV
jgi:hypothetical protein